MPAEESRTTLLVGDEDDIRVVLRVKPFSNAALEDALDKCSSPELAFPAGKIRENAARVAPTGLACQVYPLPRAYLPD